MKNLLFSCLICLTSLTIHGQDPNWNTRAAALAGQDINTVPVVAVEEGSPQPGFGKLIYHVSGDYHAPANMPTYSVASRTSMSLGQTNGTAMIQLSQASALFDSRFNSAAVLNLFGPDVNLNNLRFDQSLTILENHGSLWLISPDGKKIKPLGTTERSKQDQPSNLLMVNVTTDATLANHVYSSPTRLILFSGAKLVNVTFESDAELDVRGTNVVFQTIWVQKHLSILRSGVRLTQ